MMDVLAFVLLSIPRDLEMFFPMATLLGGLIGMGMLASSSELVVMMAAGRSKLNLIGSVMKASVVMMLLVLALGEWVAPQLESQARQLRAQAVSGGSLLSSPNGIWAKDGQDYIHIGEIEDTGKLNALSIYRFEERQLKEVMHSQSALYNAGEWTLNNVVHTQMLGDQIRNQERASMVWESGLTPEKLGVVIVRPESLSITGLTDYITYLEGNNQSAQRYQLAFWRKVLVPFTVAIMLLVALSFIFGPLRSVTMGARVLLGVITGFAFHVSNEVFGPVSQVYSVHPVLGALLPGLLFGAGALYVLVRKRT